MTATPSTATLATLLADAAAGTAPITLDQAVRLYAAADEDRRALDPIPGSPSGDMPVDLLADDTGSTGFTTTVTVTGSPLRYWVEEDELLRLCMATDCYEPGLGRVGAARVCPMHLDLIHPLVYYGVDHDSPDAHDQARRASHRMRLDALKADLTERRAQLNGELNHLTAGKAELR